MDFHLWPCGLLGSSLKSLARESFTQHSQQSKLGLCLLAQLCFHIRVLPSAVLLHRSFRQGSFWSPPCPCQIPPLRSITSQVSAGRPDATMGGVRVRHRAHCCGWASMSQPLMLYPTWWDTQASLTSVGYRGYPLTSGRTCFAILVWAFDSRWELKPKSVT